MIQFLIGAGAVIVFLLGSSVIFLIMPGAALKMILSVVLGICCLLGFAWLVPEATNFGSRAAVEAGVNTVVQSVMDVGEYVERDIGGTYSHNKWLNSRREKHESGFYEDSDSKKYYNAEQDKEYYQLPDGRWQEMGMWNTPVNSPLSGIENDGVPPAAPVETSDEWRQILSADEVAGVYEGTVVYTLQGSKSEKRWTLSYNEQNETIIIDQTIDCAGFLDDMIASQNLDPSVKDSLWTIMLTEIKMPEIVETGKYWYKLRTTSPAHNIAANGEFFIDLTRTKIKLIEPTANGKNEIIIYKQE